MNIILIINNITVIKLFNSNYNNCKKILSQKEKRKQLIERIKPEHFN